MRTAQKWLDIELHDLGPDYKGEPQFTCIKCKQTYPTHETSRCPASDLAVELGRVFTPEPWDHCGTNIVPGICNRCGNKYSPSNSCTAPGPIKLDWTTAMEKFRQHSPSRTILRQVCGPVPIDCISWFLVSAQPKHYLIAAAMAVERSKT